ncbi:shugoshin 2 isoform X2 [Tyto alba]|uniref:shugoshin 2 isoform X2 n=1 Tax=Tyto alba TaxID=56313 RepID=UPI001C67F3C9|nr:shugoshin 2 isoform X2 [Tyto alba]
MPRLRQKSKRKSLNNTFKEFENLMAAVKMARLSEFHTSFASLSNDQIVSMTEDSWADDIADGQLVRAVGMPMRVPVSKLCDAGQQDRCSTTVQTSSVALRRPASNQSLEIVPVASKDTLQPQSAEKSQCYQEENGKKATEAMEAQEAFLDSCIFGEALCAAQQNHNNLPARAWESHPLSYEGNEMAKHLFDRLSQGHVTQRRKRSTLFATSTPSSAVGTFPCVSSTQAAQWSMTKHSSGSSKSNTQPQLESPISLVSPTQTTVIPDRKSLGKEIFCDQPQAKETGYGIETDPSYSHVPEFFPVKAKSKGNCKTCNKTTVKKASTGKNKTNAIKNDAESSPDIPQGEESAQNVKKRLQPKVATCSSESEVSEKRQKACVKVFNRKNRGYGAEKHSCSPDEVQDHRKTYVVKPAQLHSLGSGELLEEVKKEAIFESQSMESLSKSPVYTFSSHDIPTDDCSLRNSLFLRKETSSACSLQDDSSVSAKSIRQKTNKKTRVIRQRDDSEEENLPNSVKIPDAKAEKQSKRSQTSQMTTVRKSSCSDQRNEVDVFGPCIDVQAVTKESAKDSPGNLKCSRKTYIVSHLDLVGNSDCLQTDFEGGEIIPLRSTPGRKASKIPRIQRIVAAQSNKKQIGGLQEKRQAEVDNNMNASEKEAYPKPKTQKKRNTSRPPETDSLARQSDGAKVLIRSSAELASKQTVLTGKPPCLTDLLSDPNAFLEQIAEISLTNNLMDLSHSPESSSVTCSGASPVSSRLTDVSVSKSLSTEDNRTPEKSPVWPEGSLIFKEKTAEEIPGERNQVESSSWNSPSREPEIRPLQDLTNAGTVVSSSSEEGPRRLSRRRRDPACYAEPKLNRKLRQGDPFTSMEFLNSPVYKVKKKRTAKAKEMTKKIKEDKEWLHKGCAVPQQAS